MKKIRNTNSKILFALSLMFATSALGLISFGTMCAFQNKEQESFQYQTDIKPLSSYFDGGNGTSPENAYIISTEQTFINFQKLVQLGCFTYNTYFKLGADIIVNTDADNQYSADDIPALIKPILENKADINHIDIDGFSPLAIAVDTQNAEIINLLLTYNPNFDNKDVVIGLLDLVEDENIVKTICRYYGIEKQKENRTAKDLYHRRNIT